MISCDLHWKRNPIKTEGNVGITGQEAIGSLLCLANFPKTMVVNSNAIDFIRVAKLDTGGMTLQTRTYIDSLMQLNELFQSYI